MSTQLKTVLISGATGFLGTKITNAFLAKKEFDILVLARKPSEKTDEFKSKGAKIVEGDLSDVESLKKATSGVDVVVSVIGKEALGLQPNLIEAAAYSKVKRIIPSEFGNDTESMPKGHTVPWDLKKSAQEQIHKLGLDYTFIINNPFMDNLFGPFAGVNLKEKSINLYGDAVMTAIHTDDIARLVPEILLNPNTKNKTVRLGAETFKWNDIIAELETLTGSEWKKVLVTPESLDQQIQATDNALQKFSLGAQKFILKTSGAALSPLDNLTDPFYAHIKPVSVKEYLAKLVQQK